MNSFWIYIMIAAVLCGSWPNVAKFAHLNSAWISFLFAMGTGIITIFGVMLHPALPPVRSIAIGTFAGVLNGLGLLALAALLARQEDVSRVLPIFLGFMTIFSVVGALLLLGEALTVKKLIGALVIAFGVYILS